MSVNTSDENKIYRHEVPRKKKCRGVVRRTGEAVQADLKKNYNNSDK